MKRELFQDDKLVFFDGAMGTMLQEAGWSDAGLRKYAIWHDRSWWNPFTGLMLRAVQMLLQPILLAQVQ